jgi:hypothetical protein
MKQLKQCDKPQKQNESFVQREFEEGVGEGGRGVVLKFMGEDTSYVYCRCKMK